jgi:hypothetical protein
MTTTPGTLLILLYGDHRGRIRGERSRRGETRKREQPEEEGKKLGLLLSFRRRRRPRRRETSTWTAERAGTSVGEASREKASAAKEQEVQTSQQERQREVHAGQGLEPLRAMIASERNSSSARRSVRAEAFSFARLRLPPPEPFSPSTLALRARASLASGEEHSRALPCHESKPVAQNEWRHEGHRQRPCASLMTAAKSQSCSSRQRTTARQYPGV